MTLGGIMDGGLVTRKTKSGLEAWTFISIPHPPRRREGLGYIDLIIDHSFEMKPPAIRNPEL